MRMKQKLMKQKLKIISGCLITAGLTLTLLLCSTKLFADKASSEKYAPFFAQEADYDVLFMGTSHVIYGISPMDLWNDYGIVSYNFGTPAQVIPATYWLMENALDYTSPKLVVIDCYTLSDTRKIVVSAHSSFDAFPLTKTKAEAIFDLFENEDTDLTRMEFFWNYSSYHFRWNELDQYDFDRRYTKEKGGGFLYEIESGNELVKIPAQQKMETDTASVEYLGKMIEDCQARGIDVLLTYLPFPADEKSQMEANRVYDIARQYDVDYINFLDLDLVNYATDCADDNHLNVFGIRKVTDYIGGYITQHYAVDDQRNNEAYQNWHSDYADYRNMLQQTFNDFESLDYCLLLLFDKRYLTTVEVNHPAVWDDDYYVGLFETMGIDKDSLTDATDLLVIREAGVRADCYENFHVSGEKIATEAGTFFFSPPGTENPGLYRDEINLAPAGPESGADEADIRILVFDKTTSELVNQCCFSKTKTKAIRSYRKQ